MMVPLVLIAVIQTEQIQVFKTKMDGGTDTYIAHQGVHPTEGGAGVQMREIIMVERHPRLTEFECKRRTVE
ncbi:hypothetical protein D3C77_540130 [compost metagenome]